MATSTSFDIARKELALFFSSPIGYLFLAVYLGITLFVFFWVEQFFARNIADVRPMFEWLPVLLIFLAAALTMRTWSDERRVGTIEFLSTVPVRDWELVLGKFLACLLLLVIALAMTLPLPITVAALGNIDWGPVFAGYVASVLLGAAYIAIGVFVSSRSENQIVALILSVLACSVFYAVGSPFLTELVNNETADVLRGLGSGSRFESITRGVVDFRDLYFYVSVTLAFLALNVYSLRQMGWSDSGNATKHRQAAILLGLLAANLLIANVWLNYVKVLRWDVTEGDQYSISDVTKNQLAQLTEPMLIRGYFSAKTHPLLAPLVPQLSDLLAEYELSGRNVVRVEIIDPTEDPALEDEANSKYGIRPVPFQVRDRHEASLVNSYFNVLVSYGDDYEVLGFQDLIEVKAENEFDLDVQLKNPEYQLTRSVKKVRSGFRSGGSPFDFVQQPVRFTGYVSNAEKLPPELEEGRAPLISALEALQAGASGKFDWSIIDPEADDGAVAEQIALQLGLQPMAASLFDVNRFYFYLTLTDDRIVVTLPLPDSLDVDGFNRVIEEGLQRFATGLLTSVALYSPMPPPQPPMQNNPYMQQPQQIDDFREIYASLTEDFDVQKVQLDTAVPTDTDLLVVARPSALSRTQAFHIDQFLMMGGTVVVASSAYTTTLTQQAMTAIPTNTGLDDWLAHHGIEIEEAMLMDSNNSSLALPVTRRVGPISIQEMRMFDYPFFVEIPSDGFNQDNPITNSLNQLSLPWSSPVKVLAEQQATRTATTLLRTGNTTWRDSAPEIMPKVDESGVSPYFPTAAQSEETVGVLVEGRFTSFFDESPVLEEAVAAAASAENEDDDASIDATETAHEHSNGHFHDHAEDGNVELTDAVDELGTVASVISQSPESARLIVIGSSSFLADSALGLLASSQGQRYTASTQLVANLADWAVEDTALMSIRGRGHFSRTLPPLTNTDKQVWEYTNYALALLLIAATFAANAFVRSQRNRRYRSIFGDAA
ncbi:MAG: ABC transporter permease subunit [Gammaproteobacteria bacterium]|nr:ABC transporter permease subunit [Gammaproteobacteria bacterium]